MSLIDEYLKKIEPHKRAMLEEVRQIAKEIEPDTEEMIYYNMPTLAYKGKALLAFDAHINHIGIYPCSGQVVSDIKPLLEKEGYTYTKGAIHFPYDKPISKTLLQTIINHRKAQIETDKK